MDEAGFRASLTQDAPPADWPAAWRALWWDARGDWDRAHAAAMESGQDADHVHAYLHRKEGDPGNAAYWYRRAGVPVARGALEEEAASLLRRLLAG